MERRYGSLRKRRLQCASAKVRNPELRSGAIRVALDYLALLMALSGVNFKPKLNSLRPNPKLSKGGFY